MSTENGVIIRIGKFMNITLLFFCLGAIGAGHEYAKRGWDNVLQSASNDNFPILALKILCYVYFGFFVVGNFIVTAINGINKGSPDSISSWFFGSILISIFYILVIIFIHTNLLTYWIIHVLLIPPLILSGFAGILVWPDALETEKEGLSTFWLQLLIHLIFLYVLLARIYFRFFN